MTGADARVEDIRGECGDEEMKKRAWPSEAKTDVAPRGNEMTEIMGAGSRTILVDRMNDESYNMRP